MDQYKASLIAFLFLYSLLPLCAQDGHYNGQQPDAKGTLGGGTGTAGCREVSAIFYNPGILAFFKEANVGFSGNLYAFDFMSIDDGELPLSGSQFQVMPSMFVVSLKFLKNYRIGTTFGFLNNGFYNGRISGKDIRLNNYQNQEVQELYRFDLRTNYKNDWFGGSFNYRLHEKVGIGCGVFLNTISKTYLQQSAVITSEATEGEGGKVLNEWNDSREFRTFNPGLLFNFGISYREGNHEWGLTFTLPRVNVSGFAYSSFERFYKETDNLGNTRFSVLSDPQFRSIFKRPLEINVGYAYSIRSDMIRIRVSYFGGHDAYINGRSSAGEIRTGVFNQPDQFNFLPMEAIQSVLNVGIGYDLFINNKISLLGGLRTDYTYFDSRNLSFSNFTSTMIRWNIYRASLGIQWAFKRLRLHSGIEYGFEFGQDAPHLVDFSEINRPFDEIPRNYNTRVSYNQLKLFIGLDFRFLSEDKKD